MAVAGSSQPHIGPEPALELCAKVARGIIMDWMNRNHEEQWQPIGGQRQTKGFFKESSTKKAGELLSMNINQPRIMTKPANRILSLKRTSI